LDVSIKKLHELEVDTFRIKLGIFKNK